MSDKGKHQITIPQRFYDDHVERDLPAGDEVCRNRSGVTVSVDDGELAELLDDAKYYAGKYGPENISMGLKSSARATVQRIRSYMQGLPSPGSTGGSQ